MDDPLTVRLLEPIDDLRRNADRLFDGDGTAPQTAGERLTIDSLEDEIGRAVQMFEPIDRGDAGMVERREDACFAFKPLQARRIAAERAGQRFDRHFAAQARVERAIDAAHSSRAEKVEHLVTPEPLSWSQRRLVVVVRQSLVGRNSRWRASDAVEHRPQQGTRVLVWFLDELSRLVVCREERFDLAAEIDVAATGLLEKRGAMLRRELEGGVVQIAGFLISLRIHQVPP